MYEKLLGIGLALSLALSVSATGCSSKTKDTTKDTSKKATVTFWGACISQDRDAFFKNLINTAKQKYPNIKLDYCNRGERQ